MISGGGVANKSQLEHCISFGALAPKALGKAPPALEEAAQQCNPPRVLDPPGFQKIK